MNKNLIYFSLPGFYTNFSLNKFFIELYKTKKFLFNTNICINSVYGSFPGNIWGLERFVENFSLQKFNECIKYYEKNNIEIIYEMNNTLVDEQYINNKICNKILSKNINTQKGIIINSNILYEYVKNKYPTFNFLTENIGNNFGMKIINKKYADNNTSLDNENYELVLNDFCKTECQKKEFHIKYLAKEQLLQKDVLPYFPCDMPFECNYNYIKSHNNFISLSDIYNKYLKKGYIHYRISTGTYIKYLTIYCTILDLAKFYIYYLVKKEYHNEVSKSLFKKIIKEE